ncbi:hypothetical protein BJX64DRAFT_100234 [Aspergillus heterothallicus]
MRVGWKGDMSVWKVAAVALIMTSGVDMSEVPSSYYTSRGEELSAEVHRKLAAFIGNSASGCRSEVHVQERRGYNSKAACLLYPAEAFAYVLFCPLVFTAIALQM